MQFAFVISHFLRKLLTGSISAIPTDSSYIVFGDSYNDFDYPVFDGFPVLAV